MEYRCDSVIIGAGPAGLACAITMQKARQPHCVIERATFPRNKTCAGLVTDKTYRLIRELFDGDLPADLFCDSTDEIRLFHRKELLTAAKAERPVRLVNRSHFDNALADRYKALGGTLYEGETHIGIDYENRRITLKSGDAVCYKRLLFADGALSMAHHLIRTKKSDLAFGVEAYIPAELADVHSVDLFFGYLKDGYGWAFPHGDMLCVGVADHWRKSTDYRAILAHLLTDMGVDTKGIKYIGAYLPYGRSINQRELPSNVMFLGDAAGLTDPISGEGLYMSMQSGVTAAQAVNADDPKERYLDGIAPLIDIVNSGRKIQRAFYSPALHRVFLHKVKDNPLAVSFFFENMVENYRYTYSDAKHLYRDYKNLKRSSGNGSQEEKP